MKKFSLYSLILVFGLSLQAQIATINPENQLPRPVDPSVNYSSQISRKSLKGGGDIFWEEHFDWGDSTSNIGWRLPSDWKILDPTDLGYNWHWANDTLKGVYTNEAPFHSTTESNGFLALNLDGYNSDRGNYNNYLAVNSTIVSPVIDCSAKSSVIVRVEQRFRYWSATASLFLFEVTNDAGAHWAGFDMKMDALSTETVAGLGPREKVDLYLNLSVYAAGMPKVQFRITWRDARLYYWMIDDIVFMEGWDTDLQMLYYEADYDNGLEDPEGFYYQVPKTQISGYNFYSVVRNFGNLEQEGTNLNVKVMKNKQYIWERATDPFVSYPLVVDTLILDAQYTPEEYGHYQIDFAINCDNPDELPGDNYASIPFNITDSVFSRGDDTRETSFSTWYWYTADHEGDYMGTWYTLKQDEEINSITAYINSADVRYSIRLVLFVYNAETGDPHELLSSTLIQIDSTMLKNHWVTLPLEKDGEGEFLKAGESYLAAVYFTSPMTYAEAYNSRRYSLGSDRSTYYPFGKSWYYFSVEGLWRGSLNDLFMIKMNFKNDDNLVDGKPSNNLINKFLEQNYPNPFSGTTKISFNLAKEEDLNLTIVDITGKVVYQKAILDANAGHNEIIINALQFESGTYFYTLSGVNYQETKKMTIAK